ncbi:MAG: ACT domain-containing protein [Gemmataceae bacterium]|nr:ACT domain-containing protein [Gemmataceae bacterium]
MRQITIVHEDRPGLLADVSEILGRFNVNIDSMSAESMGKTAVLTLLVNNYDEALRALAQSPFKAVSEAALVVGIPDKPGELARIMARFKAAGINLRSVVILRRDQDKAIVALATDRTGEAIDLVRDILLS